MRRFGTLLVVVGTLLGCASTQPVEDEVLTLKAQGLYTYRSAQTLPEGALTTATNVEIRTPDIIQPRKGFPLLSPGFPTTGTARSMAYYQGHLIVHTSANKLAYLDSLSSPTAWTELSGTYSPPSSTTPVRFFQARENLYFTTSAGIYKLDAYNGTPVKAGGVRALHATAALETGAATTGFLSANAQVAYRVIWARKDANGYVVEGTPSERLVVSGASNAKTITTIVRAASTVTVTCTAHGYSVADVVYVLSTDPDFPSGVKTVATVPGANSFTYTETGNAVTGAGTFTTSYATKDVTVTVKVPSDVVAGQHYARVFRTAQSVDYLTDPGDEVAQVYERVATNLDVSSGSFSFADISPDALRGALAYSNASQAGILGANEPPPYALDAFFYRDMAIALQTTSRQTLVLRLLSTSAIQSGAVLQIANRSFIAGTVENIAGFTFAVDTTSASVSQQIDNTMRSLVRVVNGNSGFVTAEYLSGPDDPPGIVGFVEKTPNGSVLYAYHYNGSADPWVPALPVERGLAAGDITRAANVVTVSTTAAHGFAVGQQVVLTLAGGGTADPNFAVGTKTVASVPTSSTFTYAETGSNATLASSDYLLWSQTNAETAYPFDVFNAPAGIQISKPGEPEAMPTVNHVDIGSGASGVYTALPLRERFYVYKADGLWVGTGTSPETLSIAALDGTLRLFAPRSAVALNNHAFAWADQGIVETSDSGSEIISWPIKDQLEAIRAASPTNAAQLSFAVADEAGKRYILWTTDTTGAPEVSQAFVYNILTQTWTKWDGFGPRAGLWDAAIEGAIFGDGATATVRREAHSGTLLDFYDATYTYSVTFAYLSGSTWHIVLDLPVDFGGDVGDAIKAGSTYATIATLADDGNGFADITLSPDIAALHTGAVTTGTIYGGYTSRVEWAGQSLGDAGKLKQVREAQVLLSDARFNSATLDFYTDLDTAWEGPSIAGAQALDASAGQDAILRSYVPQPKSYCNSFHPRVTWRTALGSWKMNGLSIIFRRLSERTSK